MQPLKYIYKVWTYDRALDIDHSERYYEEEKIAFMDRDTRKFDRKSECVLCRKLQISTTVKGA